MQSALSARGVGLSFAGFFLMVTNLESNLCDEYGDVDEDDDPAEAEAEGDETVCINGIWYDAANAEPDYRFSFPP